MLHRLSHERQGKVVHELLLPAQSGALAVEEVPDGLESNKGRFPRTIVNSSDALGETCRESVTGASPSAIFLQQKYSLNLKFSFT